MPNLKDLFPGLDLQDFGSGSAQVSQWAKGDDTSLIPAEKLGSVDAIQTKLDGIEEGAEVNVNADWNSTSGDSQILNLPTDLATEGYVNTKVADLVDTAPEALDTLNELASALGDDPNFATTTSTLIGTNASDIDAVEARLDTVEAFDYVETDHTGDVSIDGNVGIGTTSPSTAKLVVETGPGSGIDLYRSAVNANFDALRFRDSTNANTEASIGWSFDQLRLNSTNNTVFTTGGTERMRIDSSGKVGIGTTSPNSTLSVGSGDSSAVITPGGTNTHLTLNAMGAQGALIFGAGGVANGVQGSERMRIDSSGNVGIGTDSPSSKLHVVGDSSPTIKVQDTTNNVSLSFLADHSNSFLESSSNMLFRTNGSNNRMIINSAGNVGIGTTNPDAKFQVKVLGTSGIPITTAETGTLSIGSVSSTATASLLGRQTSATTGLWIGAATSDANASGDMEFNVRENDGSTFSNLTNAAFIFSHFSAKLLTVLRNGKVGIGTDSPNRNLHVIGQFAIDNSTSPTGGLLVSPDGTSNKVYSRIGNADNTPHPLDFISGGSTSMRIDSTGNVGIGTTSPGTINGVPFSSVGLHVKAGGLGRTITEGSNWAEYILNDSGASVNERAKFIEANDGTLSLGSYDDNGTQRTQISILNDGNVGIGTTTPTNNLQVTSFDDGGGITIQRNSSTSGAYADLMFSVSTADVASPKVKIRATRGASYDDTDISFITNAFERMRIASNGNVGIGTDSPDAKLEVNSGGGIRLSDDVAGRTLIIKPSLSGAAHSFTSDNTAAGYSFSNNANELMRIAADGNVGIGTTNPSAKLDVLQGAGGVAQNIINSAEQGFRLSTIVENTSTDTAVFRQGIYHNSTENATIAFFRGGSTTGGFMTFQTSNGNERMRIDSTGNVGIGTDSPASLLSVRTAGAAGSQDFATFSRGTTTEYEVLKISRSAGDVEFLANQNITLSADYDDNHTGGSSNIILKTDNEEAMRIISSGNVGIGTDSPSSLLQVGVGTSNQPSAVASLGGSDNSIMSALSLVNTLGNAVVGQGVALDFHVNAGYSPTGRIATIAESTSSPAALAFYTYNSGLVEKMRIDSNGNVGIGTTNPATKLNVSGNIAVSSGNYLSFSDFDLNYNTIGRNTSVGGIQITTGASATMNLLDDGNVGIGTASPGAKLEVAGDAWIVASNPLFKVKGSGHAGIMIDRGSTSYDANLMFATGGSTNWRVWNDSSNDTLQIRDEANSANVMTWKTGGNVGIGTTSPGAKLDVDGEIKSTSATISGTVAFNSLKDTAENITIAKFVDEVDGLANNDNDTTIPTSAAVVDHVDIEIKDKRQDSYKVIGLAMDYMSRVHNDGGVVEGMEQVMKNTEKLILS